MRQTRSAMHQCVLSCVVVPRWLSGSSGSSARSWGEGLVA